MVGRKTGDVPRDAASGAATTWTFLTNHAHVLLCIAADSHVRLRDVAASVGITERSAQHIVAELEQAGYLERRRVGRRNEYVVHADRPLRHPMDAAHQVGELLAILGVDVPPRRPIRRSQT